MFGTVLISTLICVAVWFLPQLLSPSTVSESLPWLFASIVGNLLLNFLVVYVGLPAMLGPLAGYQFLWLPLALNACFAGVVWMFKSDSGDDGEVVHKIAFYSSLGGIVFLFVVFAFIGMATLWGDGNAKSMANFLPITTVEGQMSASKDAPAAYPDTDPTHIVMVEISVARFKGSLAMGQTGQNLGAVYQPGDYTLQNVNKHLYWIAPIVYQNVFANLSNQTSPGMIVVDAENPDADAFLKMEHPLHYFPDAYFSQNLYRYLYTHGHSNYLLIDPTLEVDDDWQPHFTVDVSTYQRGLYGVAVQGVLVVNSETGEIAPYKLADKPAWIDRVLPVSAIDQNIDDYAAYYASPWPNWLNFAGTGIEMRADDTTPIAYSTIEGSPVYQYILTSKNSTDHSSIGMILVDSNKYEAKRYPVYGMAVGSKVTEAFVNAPENKKNNYPVTPPVLYKIFGRLTWVATYITSNETQAQYAMVGFLDAYNVNATNVVMAPSKEEALNKYQLWLANRPTNTGDPSQEAPGITKTGKIVAIIVSEVQNGYTTYYFTIEGDDTIFSVNPSDATAEIRFTKSGDIITFTYLDLGNRKGAVKTFDNLLFPPQ